MNNIADDLDAIDTSEFETENEGRLEEGSLLAQTSRGGRKKKHGKHKNRTRRHKKGKKKTKKPADDDELAQMERSGHKNKKKPGRTYKKLKLKIVDSVIKSICL